MSNQNFGALAPLALLCLLAPMTVTAQSQTDLAKCAAITDGAKRLVCFDGIAVKAKATPQNVVVPAAGKGKWVSNIKVSPIDDSKNVTLMLSAEAAIRTRFGQRYEPTLILRCSEKTTDAFITWGTFVDSDEADMLVRFDKEAARTYSLSTSTDYEAVFFSGSLPAISMIRKALNHSTMLTQVTPHGDSPVMATFDIRGLKAAVVPLQEACGWK